MKFGSKELLVLLVLLLWFLTSCAVPKPPDLPQPIVGATEIAVEPTAGTDRNGFGVKICEIQGAQHRSPLDGQLVEKVFGIVTAIRGDGFYIQDPEPDNNNATSEAIFVSASGFGRVKVGDAVLVSGKVREFNPAGIGENSLTITQIVSSDYEVFSNANLLPEPVILGSEGRPVPDQVIDDDIKGYAGRNGTFDADQDGLDYYESLESMRVQVNDGLAVSATSNYEEVAVVSDAGKLASVLSERVTLVVREGDFNPERIILDDAFINMPGILPGALFTEPIIGIMDYTFGNYKLQPIQKLKFVQGNPTEDKTEFSATDGQLSVATYNVENLNYLDYPDRISMLAEEIVYSLKSPDILGLQEIQDDDGTMDSALVSSEKTLSAIVEAIITAGGPRYKSLAIDPVRNADGGVPGGNIRVALLYRTDRGISLLNTEEGNSTEPVSVVSVQGFPQLTLNPGRIEPENHYFFSSRKPMAVQFEISGKTLFIVVAHLNSKGEDGPLFGDIQPPPLLSENQRVGQSALINAFVKGILSINPEAYIIVMGDLNDFSWSAPIKTLCGSELINLVGTLPEDEQYTYNHEGNGQVLDHIMVSAGLKEKFVALDIVHLNSEKLPDQRLSDHDPVLAIFDW